MNYRVFLVLFIAFVVSYPCRSDTVYIAAASNFSSTLVKLAADFERQSEHRVKSSFSSTGKLYAQILHGAPFHIFFSADQPTVEKLVQQGLASNELRRTYAQGKLALWGGERSNNNHDSLQLQHQLKQGAFSRLAIANPGLAPYGYAATEVLGKLNIAEAVSSKLVYGENISQTFQFVASGNAQLGFVALSQLIASSISHNDDYWLIPETLYTPIKQDVTILKSAENTPAAHAFWQYLQSGAAQQIILNSGYQVPE